MWSCVAFSSATLMLFIIYYLLSTSGLVGDCTAPGKTARIKYWHEYGNYTEGLGWVKIWHLLLIGKVYHSNDVILRYAVKPIYPGVSRSGSGSLTGHGAAGCVSECWIKTRDIHWGFTYEAIHIDLVLGVWAPGLQCPLNNAGQYLSEEPVVICKHAVCLTARNNTALDTWWIKVVSC